MSVCTHTNVLFGLNLLELIGAGAVFVIAFIAVILTILLAYVAYLIWIGPLLGHNVQLKKMGKWAVVTGATDGIGKSYAEELARLGLDVVLVSRTASKLKTVAEEIESKYKVQTRIITADFTCGPEIYASIASQLDGLEIGVLVNNVGMSYDKPTPFLDVPDLDKFTMDMIHCNCLSMTSMIRIILPQMVQRKKGVIINLASVVAAGPTPLLALYGATKAYVDKLSCDLQTEYAASGVVIQSVLPGFVATNMSKIRRASYMVPTPKVYVQGAINTVGMQTRTASHLPHRVYLTVFTVFNTFLPRLAARSVYHILSEMRKRALKKQQKEKAN